MSGPLEGVRVLAISQFGAGPYGTQALADLSAEVIKIEDPVSGGDVARYVPPFEIDRDSLYFQSFNRGKKSVAIDLRHPAGLDVFRDLVRISDAVYNNLRGDLPARLGLDYDGLCHLNRAIVCCSLSGFGTVGPRKAQPGYDAILQALCGYMDMTGEPGGPPTKCGVSIIDFAGGLASALGLAAALVEARSSGVGRNVDVSLFGTAVSMLSYLATWNLNREWQPARTEGSSHQTLVPSQNFETADGWITVFCAKEKFWLSLVHLLDLPELAEDSRFSSFAARNENRDELLPALANKFRERTTADWLDAMSPHLPCAPVNDLSAALSDPQVAALGMISRTHHPEYGEILHTGSPIDTGSTESSTAPAPKLGQHTDDVLSGLLGYDSNRISLLRQAGAVA